MKKLILITAAIFIANLLSAQVEFWGMTSAGGPDRNGVIFKTDGTGHNQSVEYYFPTLNQGKGPTGSLCIASNGKLYGMTSSGGANGQGVLFEYNIVNDTVIKKVDFNGTNGKWPMGSLIQASNGKLYGMTSTGGVNNKGVLFEYNIANDTLIKKVDFNGTIGKRPYSSLIQASNGKLYGMTSAGGNNSKGVLFEYDIVNDILVAKVSFNETNGDVPYGSLIQATNGKLYGMTWGGGANYKGVLFEYDITNGILIKKVDFNGANGRGPRGSLIQASNGKLYGMTSADGANYKGVLFEYDILNDTLIKKVDFNGTNGDSPEGSLIQATNGKFYAMTPNGGANNKGVLFEYDLTNGTLVTVKTNFDGNNGHSPKGSLVQTTNGKLYGMTIEGGQSGSGVIFEYIPSSNTFTKKKDFNITNNGDRPSQSLIKTSNNKLYGLTISGGTKVRGTLFEYDPVNHILNKKVDFDNTKGSFPTGSLIQASNGKLYGMTSAGGVNYKGTLFEYDIVNNVFNKKVDFIGTNGSQPYGSLIQATNGKLYGTTCCGGTNGGANGYGVLFEYDIANNVFIKKVDFNGTNGTSPRGVLIQASNGKLYGLTRIGGANNHGVLFEYNIINNTLTKKVDFNGTTGISPLGSLIQASNGKLYGMTGSGGANNKGVLFEYDIINNTLIRKVDFDSINGYYPKGDLMQGSNGKLYGMTSWGGVKNLGVVFEYDIINDTLIKTLDFIITNGYWPEGNLIETGSPTSIKTVDKTTDLSLTLFPNPNTGDFSLQIESTNGIQEIYTLEVFSPIGALIHSEQLEIANSLNKQMHFEHLSKGVYFIRLSSKLSNLNARFIVQ